MHNFPCSFQFPHHEGRSSTEVKQEGRSGCDRSLGSDRKVVNSSVSAMISMHVCYVVKLKKRRPFYAHFARITTAISKLKRLTGDSRKAFAGKIASHSDVRKFGISRIHRHRVSEEYAGRVELEYADL